MLAHQAPIKKEEGAIIVAVTRALMGKILLLLINMHQSSKTAEALTVVSSVLYIMIYEVIRTFSSVSLQ